MRFGLVYVNEIKYDDLAWVFVANEMDAEIIDTGISVFSKSHDDAQKVAEMLLEKHIDIAITMDFCPAVSDACMITGARYMAWIYDSPQQELYSDQVRNECNYIYSFDRRQVEEIRRLGAFHVFYQPLATNVMRNSGLVINSTDEKRFACDVSFAGNLYVDDFYDKVTERASDNLKKELDLIVSDAYGKWDGTGRIRGRLTKEAIDELLEINGCGATDYKLSDDDFFSSRLITRKLAYMERLDIVKRLSPKGLMFYTTTPGNICEGLGVSASPPLSYDEDLPKLYNLSKINLNISLHSIEDGIPLRVFDIMGVGGFMLSNYQPAMDELFVIGQDIEVFHDIEELDDKVDYYLSHEDQRIKIALQGYKTVSEKCSYDRQFANMLKGLL